MRIKYLAMIGAIGVGASAMPAYAGCGSVPGLQPSFARPGAGAALRPADYEPDEGIVGLWSVQFLANGGVFDFGYQQWHRDHTEILNSGGRAPATENFCLGVWQRAGARYVLNHYALSYDPATGKLNARVNIREEVGLDAHGNAYAGTFSLQVIDPTRNTVLQTVTGRVTGKRITVESGPVP